MNQQFGSQIDHPRGYKSVHSQLQLDMNLHLNAVKLQKIKKSINNLAGAMNVCSNAHRQQGGTLCHIVLLLLNEMGAKTMCTIVVGMISNFVEFVEQKRAEKEPRKRSCGQGQGSCRKLQGRGSHRKLQMTKKTFTTANPTASQFFSKQSH